MEKMSKDALGKRMKEFYENRTKQFLTRRTNTIIRLDGKSFGNFTKGYERPFDDDLINMMNKTAFYLCENIQGVVMAYTQSDEITLILQDYDKLTTDAWFDGNVQKIVSVSASMATAAFNAQLSSMDSPMALFDSRTFTIAEREEVINQLIWRQQDCVRNSISMVAQSLYSHKELHKKSANEMQEMIFQKGQNWNDLDVGKKRGRMVVKEPIEKFLKDEIGESLMAKNDERVSLKNEKYVMSVLGWSIRDAVDFNKNKNLINLYFDKKDFQIAEDLISEADIF